MNQKIQWRPTASIDSLQKRALIMQQIRTFFADKKVMEVDTPCLANAPVTDPHLANFSTKWISPNSAEQPTLYLQTSPEYAMKRLLCAGSGCIYQLAKAFRNEESGRYHNAEFTMLEWYRLNMNHWQLMDEVEELLQLITPCTPAIRVSYQELFLQQLNIDPLTITLEQLKSLCTDLGYKDIAATEIHKDTLLQLLFCEKIESSFDINTPIFVYHFPASQAALAQLSKADKRVAERFELYYRGIELANGFHELTHAKEQQQRFEQDNQIRLALGIEKAAIDFRFIQALNHGLPPCSGVALGVDRLVMVALNLTHIDQAIAFTTATA